MNIAIVGYGKMGHIIENMALQAQHTIVATIDNFADDASNKIANVQELISVVQSSHADVIIEFTHPTAVLDNIKALLPLGIPIVVGTTGWADKIAEVENLAKSCNGLLFYASNYSVGVHMFYRIAEYAARLMAQYEEYDVAVWEAHHKQKADSPSGTALDTAKAIMRANSAKTDIVIDAFHEKPKPNELHVSSTRIGSVPGTHSVFFDSNADTVEITHCARNREGFAMGAVRAAQWLYEGCAEKKLQSGQLYTMSDMLDR